ncbi:diguanylate cyclase [Pseudomonas sp. WN033]|nr:diguanylate cyclase [Pseudomonas sp. WN033]
MTFDTSPFASGHTEQRLRQLDKLYHYSRLPQWLILLSASAISLLVWEHTERPVLLAWLLLIGLLVLLRSHLVNRYRQASNAIKLRLRWRLLFYLGNALSGLSMAYVHLFLVPLDNFSLQAPAYGLVTGVSLCVSIIYAQRFLAFITFALPCWLPPIIYLLSRDDPSSPYWGLMALALFSCLMLAAAFINRSAITTARANQRNEALVARLDDARQQAEALNQQLTREIQQRRQAEQHLRDSHDALEERVRQRTAELEQATRALSASETQLSLAMEASELGLWDWNLETDQVFHSHLQEIFGLPADSVTSMLRDLRPRLHPDDVRPLQETLVRHMRGNTPSYRIEYRVRHADGRWIWVEDSGRAVARDDSGRVTRMIGTRRDITARKHQQEQAQLAATVFEATSEGIYILDPELNILAVNQAFSVISGYAAGDVIGQPIYRLNDLADTFDTYQRLSQLLRTQDRWQGELLEQRRSGERYPQWLQLTVVRNHKGETTHLVGFFADLTTHRQTEEQLQYLTNFDALTQLANRNLFNQRLQEATGRARQYRYGLALLHIDLDRFKYINDTLGHDVADQLLRLVAGRLSDLAPEADTLARLSADEFVILVERDTSLEQLSELAAQLLEGLRQPVSIMGHELVVTASIGISQFPDTARDSLLMITQANQAMQHAKHLGGNTYRFFTRELRAYSLERLQLENQLRKAIEDNQLVVHYQPKLHLNDDSISSAEALVRWQHPQRGLVMPGDFIDMAEETGLIIALGDAVLHKACSQASHWYHQGPTPVCVSVNLSVQQLRQSNFARRVQHILEECQLPAEYLELELTESMFLEHVDAVAHNIAELRAMGIRLAVDDFGTGYSSLAYLKRFPVDTLKIDRVFVTDLGQHSQDAAITRAIIAMAHSLDLRVVAEGVERDVQLAYLKQYGCDEVQGYLISRPLSAADFTAMLQEHRGLMN